MADILVLGAQDGELGLKQRSSPLTALYAENSSRKEGGLLRRISSLAKDVTSQIIPLGLAPSAAERKAALLHSERKLILEARMEEVQMRFAPCAWRGCPADRPLAAGRTL